MQSLLVNFPDMRGFKAEPVFADGLFAMENLGEVTTTRATRTSEIDPKAPYYVIANTSASAVQASQPGDIPRKICLPNR